MNPLPLSTRQRLAASRGAPLWIAGAAALLAYGALAGRYELRLLATAGCYALAVLGYQILFGRLGALSLAQGAFFGLGAYASGLMAINLGWGFALSFPAAIALAVAVAAIVGGTVLRLGSHYFALATLAVAELLRILVIEWVSLTGGGNGLPGVPGITLFGWSVPPGWPSVAFVWAWVVLGVWAVARYGASIYGKGAMLVRDAPLAAAASGIDGPGRRMTAFLLSAGFGAAGGALYVHTLGVVSPEAMQFDVMVLILCMTVIGGRNVVAGALIGALLLAHLPEWLRPLGAWALFGYGAALLVTIVVAPEGIAGALDGLWRRWFGSPPLPILATGASDDASRVTPAAAADPAPVLAVQGVGIAFGGNQALADVSLSVRRGEILGLIGPNGSGKTTLLNLMSGFYRPDTGRIFLGGEDVTDWHDWRRARPPGGGGGLARTFQHGALADDLTALDNVAVAARDATGAREKALAALGAVDALRSAAIRGRDLSAAERRWVEIARALASEPAVILLDEPGAGLTDKEKNALRDLLRSLAARGIAIVVVDHGMPFLLPLAHRVVCLDAGRVLAEGTPAEIAAHPEVRRAYLGDAAAALAMPGGTRGAGA